MTTPLSDERIAEIRAREQAATPGPWEARHLASDRTAADDECSAGLGLIIDGPPDPFADGTFMLAADAAFVAHARTDVPDLLAEVERLRAMVRDFNTALVAKQKEIDSLASNYVAIREENQSLRYDNYGLRDTVFHLRARVARLKGLLRSVEWSGPVIEDDDGIGSPSCPWCGWVRRMVHHSRICELDAALREED